MPDMKPMLYVIVAAVAVSWWVPQLAQWKRPTTSEQIAAEVACSGKPEPALVVECEVYRWTGFVRR